MQIQLLGAPAVVVNGRRLEHPAKKAMALLAYLAMRADEHISRGHLASLLWADSDEEQARANLRQTLSQLRKLFKDAGPDPIMVPFDKIVLGSDGISIDVKSLFADLGAFSLQKLAETPDFLEGFVVQAPEFEDWVSAQRKAIRARFVAHFITRAAHAHAGRRYADEAEALSLALKIDPLQESLHRSLMDALAAQGRTDEALRQFDICQNILARELQVEPDANTRKLAAEIRARRLAKSQPDGFLDAFNRYPGRSPALVIVAVAGETPQTCRFESARDALSHALATLREADDPAALRIVVGVGSSDVQMDQFEAGAILSDTEPGTIAVTAEICDQFRHWSPFAFGDGRTLQGGHVVHRLISEISRHRLQVLPTVEAPQVPPGAEFSVAVLPLVDHSPNAGDFSLGDFLAEEITHRLSRHRSLTVAAPSATQSYRSFGYPIEMSRQMLGVNYLVDGSILREGERLMVRLTLTDLRSNRLVYSQRFDGVVSGFLSNQYDLIDQVATAIFHKTQSAEVLRAERALTNDMGAYEWFLRGLSAHRRAGILPENARGAFAHFTRAIEIDPRFARAIAWRICAVSWFDPQYMFEPGMRQIQEALAIDEEDAEVQRIAGALHLYRGDGDQGIMHIERAIELNPSDAYLLASSAVYWAYNGEPENGLKHIERAMRLDPFLPAWCLEDHGVVLYALGAYEQAAASLGKLTLPSPRALAYLAASLIAAGRPEEARKATTKLSQISRSYSADQFLSTAYYRNRSVKELLRERLGNAGLS